MASLCDTCKELNFEECEDIVITDAGLSNNTAYWWKIEDQFGNDYVVQATTSNTGDLTILIDNLPAGLCDHSNPELTLTLSTDEAGASPVDFIFDTVHYSCVLIKFFQPTITI